MGRLTQWVTSTNSTPESTDIISSYKKVLNQYSKLSSLNNKKLLLEEKIKTVLDETDEERNSLLKALADSVYISGLDCKEIVDEILKLYKEDNNFDYEPFLYKKLRKLRKKEKDVSNLLFLKGVVDDNGNLVLFSNSSSYPVPESDMATVGVYISEDLNE